MRPGASWPCGGWGKPVSSSRPVPTKTYLGDAVYCDFDGFGFVLTTEDGIRTTNRIVMEPEVCVAFIDYMQRIKEMLEGATE
jgi:hypothetical protein